MTIMGEQNSLKPHYLETELRVNEVLGIFCSRVRSMAFGTGIWSILILNG